MFDPKGDADLFKRVFMECRRCGRQDTFYVFHLGWPDSSARYNAVGRFGLITEVASRIAGQLSNEGNSAAFREFAWRFVNIIARALVELGHRPDYLLIQRHVVNIDTLFIEYAQHFFAQKAPKAWEAIVQIEGSIHERNTPRHMLGRDRRVVVYVGLDALSDTEVAAAVGNSMFADLVSVAGHLYKFGLDDGLPGAESRPMAPINVHADEFSELMGDEFIPMVNKGGGAGMQVTAYTQTLSDIEARLGNRAKAGQVIGNFNNLIMLRVRETATAELLTKQLPRVDITSSMDRITTTSVPLLEPAHIVALPKGQAFALLEGGTLWKLRMPLPTHEPDTDMPADLRALAELMRFKYSNDHA